jgi:DNA polymerase III sliding clamp (beta) subunit (PCNA family)
MNHIKLIPTFQRKKSIPKQLKDLELKPLNEQFSKLTMPIISDDDLRPAMMGNFFDMESKKIVSTDAHKLTAINMPKDTFNFLAQKYNKELNENPKGLIFHTLSQLEKDYNDMIKKSANKEITISFDEFVKAREIEDAKYPNYDAVIPKEFTNEIYVDYTKLYWYAKVLLDAKLIDDATKINSFNENEYQNKKIEYLKDSYVSFINPITHQIILTYTLDGKKEYIGFNAEFICQILKFAIEYKGKTFGKVGISGNTRAMVIEFENGLYSPNDSIGLIMPVMIMNNAEYTIGQISYHFGNVKMYYDLDTNEIISDGVNYPIDESIGFIPLRNSLPTTKVKPNIDMPNDSMSLVDSRIQGLKIALKFAKGDSLNSIQKRIKGLEIAKKMQKDNLPFKNGGSVEQFGGGGYLIQYDRNKKKTIVRTKKEADDFVNVLKENGHTNIIVTSKKEYLEKMESNKQKIKDYLKTEYAINPMDYSLIMNEKNQWKISPINIKKWFSQYGSIQDLEKEINSKAKKFANGGGVDEEMHFFVVNNKDDKNYNRVGYVIDETIKDNKGNEFEKLYFENKKLPKKYNVNDLIYLQQRSNFTQKDKYSDGETDFVILVEYESSPKPYYYLYNVTKKFVATEGGLDWVKSSLPKGWKFYDSYAKGGGIRKMELYDAVLYNGKQYDISKKDGIVGLKDLSQGAWGSDYPFIPLYKIDINDVTDMFGNKVEISEIYEDGGAIGFKGLANKVAKRYEGKSVAPKYQDEYGKRYSKSEAEEVGRKVAGKVYYQQQGRKFDNSYAKGGKTMEVSEYDLERIKQAVKEAQMEENKGKFNPSDAQQFIKDNPQLLMMLKKGGKIDNDENYEMLKSKIKELMHHSQELETIIKTKQETPAWVVAKSTRASTDLSDITHYLEGEL